MFIRLLHITLTIIKTKNTIKFQLQQVITSNQCYKSQLLRTKVEQTFLLTPIPLNTVNTRLNLTLHNMYKVKFYFKQIKYYIMYNDNKKIIRYLNVSRKNKQMVLFKKQEFPVVNCTTAECLFIWKGTWVRLG